VILSLCSRNAPSALELSTLGHRIRHHRVAHALTLDELGAIVGVAGSQLSLIENGKREPKLSLLQAIAPRPART
jgi:transcriptional regulator with XRE-family HTH domain